MVALAAALHPDLCLGAGPAPTPAQGAEAKPSLRQYDSPYYVIHTDLEPNVVREVYVRLTAMAEEYRDRTQAFGGAIRTKRPFYLFSEEEDYLKAGGKPGSAGEYISDRAGDRLLAKAGSRDPSRLWHTIQHEGFHQFADRVISPRLPVWVNEGLAEYFGEGLWTGDGMVTGVIPPSRLRSIRQLLLEREIRTFPEMMDMDPKEWQGSLEVRNYDQAWSMVHFLVNGDGGKYCQAFCDFLNDVSRGLAVKQSFQNRFGRDDKAFQARYEQWWGSLEDNPTADLYARANLATLTSFLARSQGLRMTFASAGEFLAAVTEEKIPVEAEKRPSLWLPLSLGREAAKAAPRMGDWTLEAKPSPRLVLRRSEGSVLTGTFTLAGDQRPAVKVTAEKPKAAASAPATRSAGR
jgi:hypothetical protein